MHCTPCHIIIGHFQPPPLADHKLYSILAIYTHCILAYLNKIDAESYSAQQRAAPPAACLPFIGKIYFSGASKTENLLLSLGNQYTNIQVAPKSQDFAAHTKN